MEEREEDLTDEDFFHLENIYERNKRWMRKILLYGTLILAFPLFVPLEILTKLRRSGRNMQYDSGFLFFELGPENVLMFIILPVAVIMLLIYFRLLRIPQTKKDFTERKKIIGMIRVKEVREVSATMKKDLLGTVDHEILFEPNNYKIKEQLFLSTTKPEYLTAKAYRVEITKFGRIELKREIVG